MNIGVLALQGCVTPHENHLRALGVKCTKVRQAKDLLSIDGLILPGGESTTISKLAKLFDLWQPLKEKSKEIPFWGICAGSILMAKKVENPEQESLGIVDLTVKRNAYGRQLESSEKEIETLYGKQLAVFIRAPKFISVGKDMKIEGSAEGEPVFLSQGKHLLTAFHPELTESHWFHEFFLSRI